MGKDLKHVKPSLKGMSNTGYLGHFAKDKFIQKGHNDDGKVDLKAGDVSDALDMASGDPAAAAKALNRMAMEDSLRSDEKKMKSKNGDSD